MSLSQEKLMPAQKHEIWFPFKKKFLWQRPKCKYAYTGIKQCSLRNLFHLENQGKLKEQKIPPPLLLPPRKRIQQVAGQPPPGLVPASHRGAAAGLRTPPGTSSHPAPAAALGRGLGSPVSRLNSPMLSTQLSAIWDSQTLSVFKGAGRLFTEY